jgi:hypothetical protein
LVFKPRNLLCNFAIIAALVAMGTAQAQDASAPPQPERNPLRAAKGAETRSTLPGDAPTVAWSEKETADAKAICAKLLAGLSLEYELLPPLKEGRCGAPAPILLKSVGEAPKVVIEPPATVTCKLAAALAGWLDKTVQPEARVVFGAPVIKLNNASSYVCRNRYNGADTLISEHALANALDISEFVFESGETTTVQASWPRVAAAETPPPPPSNPARVSASSEITGSAPAAVVETPSATTAVAKSNPFVAPPADTKSNPFVLPAAAPKLPPPTPPAEARPPSAVAAGPGRKGEFVVKVHQDACKSFGTVLGPNANEAHKDHFHFDMKQRRHHALCE